MEVYVIRHTQVAVGKNICYGQTDVPLADTFLEEVAQFREQLPVEFDAVYSSPLQRCKSLAAALELEGVLLDDALLEMNFGDWENQQWNDIDQSALNDWMVDFVNVKTPNGENLVEVFERAKVFFDSLRKQSHKRVLVVTHAGIIRCLWAYLLEIPLQNIFKIPVGHGEVFVCKLTDNVITDSIKRAK